MTTPRSGPAARPAPRGGLRRPAKPDLVRTPRGLGLFEFGVVAVIVTVLVAVLLSRLEEQADEAQRQRAQLSADALRMNAALLLTRCGRAPDPECWLRLLPPERRASEPPSADADGLLQSVARAAGLLPPQWQWLQNAPGQLRLQPLGESATAPRAICPIELRWMEQDASVQVQVPANSC